MKFDNSSVVINGAGSGIGAAIAHAAANKGARVCVSDINFENAQKVAKQVFGIAIQCDVTDESAWSGRYLRL